MPRPVIFDLDGTLVDSLDDIADAANRCLVAHDLPTHPTDAYRAFVGDGVRALIERAAADTPARWDELERAFRHDYPRHLVVRTAPYPGIVATLQALRRRNHPLAVLSNKPHDATQEVVRALFAEDLFQVVEGHRPERPRKPDPAGAFDVARALGVAPEQAVFVGDTRTDMETAVAAHMTPVGVLWGFRGREELVAYGAQHVVSRAEELLDVLTREAT